MDQQKRILTAAGIETNRFGVWLPPNESGLSYVVPWRNVGLISHSARSVFISITIASEVARESIACDKPEIVAGALFTVAGNYAE